MPGVPRPLRRLLHLVARLGPRSALAHLLSHSFQPVDPYPLHTPPSIHPFDLTFGVDTSGFVHGEHLQTTGASTLWATGYYAIAPSAFHAALSTLEALLPSASFAPFTFVDLGCGKGRALLLASDWPFARILGVELDQALAAVARHNLARFRSPLQQCHSLELRLGDAAALDWPLAPTVLYLYNPFLAPLLRRVLHSLEHSLARHPRDLFLIYLNPEPAAVLEQHPHFVELHRSTLPISPVDQLADRLGSVTEDLRLYRYLPPFPR